MTELDPESRALIDLARRAEDATFADRARVRRALAGALGAGAATAGMHEVVDSGVQASFSPLSDVGSHSLGFAERASGEVLRVASTTGLQSAGLLGSLFASTQAAVLQIGALLVGGALVGASAWFAFSDVTLADAPSGGSVVDAPTMETPVVAPGPAQTSEVLAPAQPVEVTPPETTARNAAPDALVPQPEPLDADAQRDTRTVIDADAPLKLEDLPAEKARRSRAHKPRRAALAKRDASADPTPIGSSLADEARGLAAVHEALRRGNHSIALARLDAMDRRPGGVLGEERLVARVLSLCGLGRVAEAENIARRVQAVAPESPLLPRLGASCAKRALSGSTPER